MSSALPQRSATPGRPASAGVLRALANGPWGLVTVAATVFALAAVAVMLPAGSSGIASWWPAAGVCVLAVAWSPQRRRAAVVVTVLLSSAAANLLLGGRPPLTALGLGAANALEAAAAAWWLLRGRRRPTLECIEDVVRLIVATGIGVVVSSTVAGLTVALTGYADPVVTARTFLASHAAAIMVITPFGMRVTGAGVTRSLAERLTQVTCTFVVVLAVFSPDQHAPLSFLPLPFLIWGALRFPPRTVLLQLLAVGVLVMTATTLGWGPFAHGEAHSVIMTGALVQAYLLTLAVVVLPLTVSVNARRLVVQGLAASERLFRQGFSDSLVGMVLLRSCGGDGDDEDDGTAPDGAGVQTERRGHRLTGPAPAHVPGGLDVVELNAVAARLLDDAEEDLLGTCWTRRLDAGDRRLLVEVVGAMSNGALDGWRGEVALRTGTGRRWLELALSPLPASVGDGMFVGQMIDATARREAEERLTAQALHDALTGLANRTLLHDRIGLALQTGQADGLGVDLLFCDLDDFKHVNDSAGHTTGDLVLVEVARRLRSLLRPGDLAARIGGDEFVLLRAADRPTTPTAPGATPGADGAEALADRVIAALAAPVVLDGQAFSVGVSIGIVHGEPGSTPDDLLRDADAAMYAAKAEGKRRAVVYSDVHRDRALRSVRIEHELRRAVSGGELEVHLQPVIELRTGATVAAEALVRWNHPGRGLLPPGDWLDVAERAGLMPELGAWVLQRSCALAAAWPDVTGRGAPVLHVNVSARQLERPGFVDVVNAALEGTGLPPQRLVLEFTETHLDEVSDSLLDELDQLRAAGIGLAADDYGTGYSPLTRIIELPLSMIKIDRRFVSEMLEDVRSRAIVTTLVRLGQALGLDVVAEGVETPHQAAELKALGCGTGQGYLWSRAVPPDEFVVGLQPHLALPRPLPAVPAAPRR